MAVTSLTSSNDEEVIAMAILLSALEREMGNNSMLTALYISHKPGVIT